MYYFDYESVAAGNNVWCHPRNTTLENHAKQLGKIQKQLLLLVEKADKKLPLFTKTITKRLVKKQITQLGRQSVIKYQPTWHQMMKTQYEEFSNLGLYGHDKRKKQSIKQIITGVCAKLADIMIDPKNKQLSPDQINVLNRALQKLEQNIGDAVNNIWFDHHKVEPVKHEILNECDQIANTIDSCRIKSNNIYKPKTINTAVLEIQ